MRQSVLWTAAAFAVLCWASAWGADRFDGAQVGFEITKPENWHFMTVARDVQFAGQGKPDAATRAAAMGRHANGPLVVMTKYPEPYSDMNPSVEVAIRPLGVMKGASPAAILAAVITPMADEFSGYRVDQYPVATRLGGRRAAYMRFHYVLRMQDGRTVPTTSELWVVPRGEYFFLIGAGTRRDQSTGSRAEVHAIVDSVVIRD
ncbi:MAG: hypothetical protein P8180_08355 [Gammaproteobacteria bacterium]